MFRVLYQGVNKETKEPTYFLIEVKGGNVSWLKLSKEEFQALEKTTIRVK